MSTRFLLTFLTVCLLSLLALGTGHCSANDGSSTSLNQFQTRAVATTFCTNNPVYYQQYSVRSTTYLNASRVVITEVTLIQDLPCLCVRNNEFTPQSLQLLSAAYALERTATKIQGYASKAVTVSERTIAAVERNATSYTLSSSLSEMGTEIAIPPVWWNLTLLYIVSASLYYVASLH